jgi:hypothetical protein
MCISPDIPPEPDVAEHIIVELGEIADDLVIEHPIS